MCVDRAVAGKVGGQLLGLVAQPIREPLFRSARFHRCADHGAGRTIRRTEGSGSASTGWEACDPSRQVYPSSKTCSSCGAVKAKLLLSEREYVCEVCGVVIDRDDNAALNLCRVAETALSAGVDSGGGSVRPDLRPAVPGEAATIERWSDTSQGVSAR